MIKIIKKNNKYYRQEIEEIEITLKELQEELDSLIENKNRRLIEETETFDNRIDEVQNQIDQLKQL